VGEGIRDAESAMASTRSAIVMLHRLFQ